jgi:predicted RecA/RadA family phage recombinase
MKNSIQRGDMITITAPTGGVTSGQGVLVGNLFGVAATTTAEEEKRRDSDRRCLRAPEAFERRHRGQRARGLG